MKFLSRKITETSVSSQKVAEALILPCLKQIEAGEKRGSESIESDCVDAEGNIPKIARKIVGSYNKKRQEQGATTNFASLDYINNTIIDAATPSCRAVAIISGINLPTRDTLVNHLSNSVTAIDRTNGATAIEASSLEVAFFNATGVDCIAHTCSVIIEGENPPSFNGFEYSKDIKSSSGSLIGNDVTVLKIIATDPSVQAAIDTMQQEQKAAMDHYTKTIIALDKETNSRIENALTNNLPCVLKHLGKSDTEVKNNMAAVIGKYTKNDEEE